MKLDGHCNCGAVTMAVDEEPSIVSICHCTDCRRFTGHISTYIIAFRSVEITGHPAKWRTRAESGGDAIRFFCGICGSGMYALHGDGAKGDKRVFVNGGHFATGTLPPPKTEYWMRSAEVWDTAYPHTLVMKCQKTGDPVESCPVTSGGCNCGKIKVRVKAVESAVVCHCTTCRRFTGRISAYLATVSCENVEIVGCPKLWRSVAASGNEVERMFCGECGNSIAIVQDGKIEVYGGILPPGSLPPPDGERFGHNAEPWAKMYPAAKALPNGN